MRAIAQRDPSFLQVNDEGNKMSETVQLMAGQTLTVLSWIERKVPGAKNLMITLYDSEMAQSDRGKSYL